MSIFEERVLPHTTVLNGYQKVDEFTYLHSIVQANGRSSREIRCRVILGREAVNRLIPIRKDNHISRNSKLWLLKTLTFSVMSYGSNTWTLKMQDVKHINAFDSLQTDAENLLDVKIDQLLNSGYAQCGNKTGSGV